MKKGKKRNSRWISHTHLCHFEVKRIYVVRDGASFRWIYRSLRTQANTVAAHFSAIQFTLLTCRVVALKCSYTVVCVRFASSMGLSLTTGAQACPAYGQPAGDKSQGNISQECLNVAGNGNEEMNRDRTIPGWVACLDLMTSRRNRPKC